jgi:hypothetical protein
MQLALLARRVDRASHWCTRKAGGPRVPPYKILSSKEKTMPATSIAPALSRRSAKRVAVVLAAAFALTAPDVHSEVVADWNLTAQQVFTAKGAAANPHYAIVQTAVYDAVVAIEGGYQPYAIRPTAPTRGASGRAAAASAAYHTLLGLFPDQKPLLDSALATSLATVPDGAAEDKGVAVGAEVAAGILTLRANDGRYDVVPYEFGSGPGVYQRTPPALANPINTNAPFVTPFALTRASQFRSYGPPDLTSARYAADLAEVRRMGVLEGSKRSPWQSEIARFHTENPNVFWIRNLRETFATFDMSLVERARLYALMNVAHADTVIACFDAKYYYNFWRPVTAIQAADTDGNPDTAADSSWMPFMNTPPHPASQARRLRSCSGSSERGISASRLPARFPKRCLTTMRRPMRWSKRSSMRVSSAACITATRGSTVSIWGDASRGGSTRRDSVRQRSDGPYPAAPLAAGRSSCACRASLRSRGRGRMLPRGTACSGNQLCG